MSKLQKAIDAVLAIFLLVTVFVFGFKTVWPNRRDLLEAARSKTRLLNYMPEDYTPLEHLTARIRSTEDKINEVLWKKTELGYFNSSIQYALGKDMITTGTSSMITLPTGDLYDLPPAQSTKEATDEVIAFANTLDVPFLYMFAHATTYPGNLPTGGYAMMDYGSVLSDQITSELRAGGLNVLDSRDFLAGESTSQTILRTDQHWTAYAALRAAHAVAEELGLDASKLEPDQFETETFPEKFLGKYGQKVGRGNVKADDIVLYYPKYETNLTRYTKNNDTETELSGPFYDSMIQWEYLEGETSEIEAYKAYGLTEDFEHFHNEDGADITLLIYKDSFGSPVSHFLALVAKDVYLVDMRKTDKPASYFVEQYQPDQVLIAYSRQMICAHEYKLMPEE